jgi:3-oxoacyl-[acyl-carrier protein] reductase
MPDSDEGRSLAGKVAIVTGAGRGIGRAEALALAREGARVVVNNRTEALAHEVAAEIREAGGQAVANAESVATMAGGGRLIAAAVDNFGRLDLLINNASVSHFSLIWEMPEAEWDEVIVTNLKGTFTTIRHAAPIFREQRSGVIINTSSESGLGHWSNSAYAASKEGIIGFTRSIARDLGQFNVRFNAIRPRAKTRMVNRRAAALMQQGWKILRWPPMGNRWGPDMRSGMVDEVGTFVAWLCSDAARDVNGRTFQIGTGEVGLWSEPELIRSSFRAEGWDRAALDNPATRQYLIGDLRNLFGPKEKKK